MKRPSFQFYPGDWRRDPGVQALTFHDRGVWIELLCIMHESSERGFLILNGKPMSEDTIARVLGLDKQILTTTLSTLLDFGVIRLRESDGSYYSKRMVEDEKLTEIRRQAGKQGGNPVLLNQKSTTRLKQKSTPSSSSSSSNALKKKVQKEKFAKPTLDELQKYGSEIGMTATEAEKMHDFYQSKGWLVGKTPMKDWKAAARNWMKNAPKAQTQQDIYADLKVCN